METVLVTGASSGIGRELARRFARDGASLVLVARRQERLQQLADKLSHAHDTQCVVIPCDLSLPSAPRELCERLAAQQLHVDVLVNNAGFGDLGKFVEQSPDRQRDMVQVNVSVPTQLARLLLPGMIERGRGGVLNIASTASFQPGPYFAVYYASKAYVRMWSEALSHELRHAPVTVTCLCPGPTLTEFGDQAGVSRTNLFRFAMPVDKVVDAGYRGFRNGRRRVVPGLLNKLAIYGVWIAPRGIVMRVVGRLHRSR